jgi:hypothetical protein
MRVRLNVYFPPMLAKQIDELAIRRRISRSAIVEAAVTSYLSPDGADRMEAALPGGSTAYRARSSGLNAIRAFRQRRWHCLFASGCR